MRISATASFGPGEHIRVVPPYDTVGPVGRGPMRVPWVVYIDELSLHVEDREVLTKLRDAITAALDANPDAS